MASLGIKLPRNQTTNSQHSVAIQYPHAAHGYTLSTLADAAAALTAWDTSTSWSSWASSSHQLMDIEWGHVALLLAPTLSDSSRPALVEVPLTMEEEAVQGYLPPEIKTLDDLLAEFPIRLEEDSGGIGLKRFHVSWLDGQRYMADGEPYDCFKESDSTCDDHHAFFYEWTQARLLKTLSHYKNLFVLHKTKKGVATFSLKEKLMPLQMIMRGPFVWDQEGSTISVRAHGKKMEAVANGPASEKFVREIVGRMMERLRESEECEVVEAPAGARFLFQVNLLGIEEAPAPKVAPKALVTPSSPLSAPTKAPLPSGPKALDVLKGFGRYVRWDRDGYAHRVEVLRSHHSSARRIHDDLLDALHKCEDCKILPPPAGSPYLFVVQVLAPRRG